MTSRIWRRLLHLAFHLLYNEFAFAYDSVSRLVSLGQWRKWQRSVLPCLGDTRAGLILELAHGTGVLQVDLLRAGYRTVAFDMSASMGHIARKRLLQEGLSTDFVRGDALTLPFASGTFAGVVSTFPTSFILKQNCLSEINRVLALDGIAIIVLSAGLKGRGLRKGFIRFLYRITGQAAVSASPAAYEDAFAGYGFSVEPGEIESGGGVVQLAALQKRWQL